MKEKYKRPRTQRRLEQRLQDKICARIESFDKEYKGVLNEVSQLPEHISIPAIGLAFFGNTPSDK